jgi:hypothetical protein
LRQSMRKRPLPPFTQGGYRRRAATGVRCAAEWTQRGGEVLHGSSGVALAGGGLL